MSICEFCFITISKSFPFCKHHLCADCLSAIYDSSSLQKGIKCPICPSEPVLVMVHQEGNDHYDQALKQFDTIKALLKEIYPNLRYCVISTDRYGNCDLQRGYKYSKHGPGVFLVPGPTWDSNTESKTGIVVMNGIWDQNVIHFDFKYRVHDPNAWSQWLKEALLDENFRQVQSI